MSPQWVTEESCCLLLWLLFILNNKEDMMTHEAYQRTDVTVLTAYSPLWLIPFFQTQPAQNFQLSYMHQRFCFIVCPQFQNVLHIKLLNLPTQANFYRSKELLLILKTLGYSKLLTQEEYLKPDKILHGIIGHQGFLRVPQLIKMNVFLKVS